jgi:hypothetical protein
MHRNPDFWLTKPPKFVKANAHSRDFGNEQADRLATAATALPDAFRS